MKLTDLLSAARPGTRTAPTKKAQPGEPHPSFEGELQTAAHRSPRADPAHAAPGASSASSRTDEVLVLTHAAAGAHLPRPASLIDTKAAALKPAPHPGQLAPAAQAAAPSTSVADPLAALISHRAQSTPHQLRPSATGSDAGPQHDRGHARPIEAEARRGAQADERLAIAQDTSAPAPTSLPLVEAPKFESALQAASAPADAAPLSHVAPMMLEDPTARAVILPTVARLAVDTGDGGQLTVQLKVNDGVTEIRAAGPAAPLLEARQGELRVALAQEGLALGQFDLTQSGRDQHHAPADAEEGAPTAPRTAPTRSTDAVTEDGRLHVKA